MAGASTYCRLFTRDELFVTNLLWSALAIERERLHVPLDRNRFGQKANLTVASLIFELACDRQRLAIIAKRVAELGSGADLDVFADAERAGENRNPFFDGGQEKCF